MLYKCDYDDDDDDVCFKQLLKNSIEFMVFSLNSWKIVNYFKKCTWNDYQLKLAKWFCLAKRIDTWNKRSRASIANK